MEDVRLALYKMMKNAQFVSLSEIVHLVKICTKFENANDIFYSNDMIRGFLQGVLDYSWKNCYGNIKQEDLWNLMFNTIYDYYIKSDNKLKTISLLARYKYGYNFAKELDLKLSNRCIVDWNGNTWDKCIMIN